MDPNTVVLEISSDEDVDWNDHVRGISDGGDDHDWLAEILDEVNKGNRGDDSDEVVVVVSGSEKHVKKSKLKSSLVDLDDDCVILDNDPNEPMEVRNDNPSNGYDDSDDILVVSEKGQVACRDYPHSRHLCIKFPFLATPNQSHCNQCYCYVCDSLAPCIYWGNGTATTDHCHATDKDDFWTLERKIAKNSSKDVQPPSQLAPIDLHIPAPVLVQPPNQIPKPGLIHTHRTSANFQSQNITNQYKNHILASRNKLHPDLVSQLVRRGHQKYNLGTRVQKPVFKRTELVGGATTANQKVQNPYSSYMGNLGNPSRPTNSQVNGMLYGSSKYLGTLQTNAVTTSVPYPTQSQSYTSSTVNQSQPQFSNHSSPNFQSRVNSNLFTKNPIYQQLNLVPQSSSRPQPTSSQQTYMVPAQQSSPVPSKTRVDSPLVPVLDNTQTQIPIVDSGFKDYGSGLPPGQDSATLEGTGSNNKSTLAAVSGGLADYRYDWIFDNQPIEPGFPDYSYDSAFIDTGPIFDF